VSGESGINRREFMKRAALAGVALYGLGRRFPLDIAAAATKAAPPSLVVASGGRPPAKLVRAALAKLGGMSRFVRRGARVVIKANAGWAMPPGSASNTNPEALAEVIRLCREAGARQVKVVEHSCDPSSVALEISRLRETAERAGAQMIALDKAAQYQPVSIPRGRVLRSAALARDVAEADVFINLPVAKVHSGTVLTLGLKNLMGVVLDRQAWHASRDLHQCIADFATAVRPKLSIIDATRILLSNGPKGPGRTADPGQIIAGTDPLAVDAYATRLFHLTPQQVPHLVAAHALGLGEIDPAKISFQNA